MNLYGIDKQLFRLASDEEKVNLLFEGQERYLLEKAREQGELIARVSAAQDEGRRFANQEEDEESEDISEDLLNEIGINRSYFNSLPEEMRVDVM